MTVVISHPEHGVFVGLAMGLAFWTNMDCAGQPRVCTFVDEADARDFAETVLTQGMDVAALTYHEVDTAKPYATGPELLKAGLTDAANALMREQLQYAEPSGLAM